MSSVNSNRTGSTKAQDNAPPPPKKPVDKQQVPGELEHAADMFSSLMVKPEATTEESGLMDAGSAILAGSGGDEQTSSMPDMSRMSSFSELRNMPESHHQQQQLAGYQSPGSQQQFADFRPPETKQESLSDLFSKSNNTEPTTETGKAEGDEEGGVKKSEGESNPFAALGRKRDDDREGGGSDRGDGNNPGFSAGDAILQGMRQKDIEAVQVSQAVKELPRITEEIAERIMVSATGLNDTPEVRIELKDSVLPDTEIRISQQDGRLTIALVSDSVTSIEMLSQALDSLQEQLNRKFPDAVEITVSTRADADASGQDGRSRNRRDLYDELRNQ